MMADNFKVVVHYGGYFVNGMNWTTLGWSQNGVVTLIGGLIGRFCAFCVRRVTQLLSASGTMTQQRNW